MPSNLSLRLGCQKCRSWCARASDSGGKWVDDVQARDALEILLISSHQRHIMRQRGGGYAKAWINSDLKADGLCGFRAATPQGR